MLNRSKHQILVVDDDPSVRKSLGMLLTWAGYEVVTADSGASAVAHLSGTVPDLIVTDLNMPNMSGIELIAHARSRYPAVPVVAMSGEYTGDAVAASLIADRFYPKGGGSHDLLTAIAGLIATKPRTGSAEEARTRASLDS